MPGTPTAKYSIPTLAGTTLARDIDTEVNAGLTAIDGKMVGYSEGPLSSRPTSTGGTPGVKGRLYKATDVLKLYIDNGTGWDEFATSSAPASGKSIIATEEARTNTAYGLLTTPDRVQGIVVPADAYVLVGFQAKWKNSVASAGRAALFVGVNQLQTRDTTAPVVQEASGGSATSYGPLASTAVGLQGITPAAGADAAADASPQVLGIASVGGGLTVVDNLAAGTYDFSVQFKSASGSVTVKERRLKVRVVAF